WIARFAGSGSTTVCGHSFARVRSGFSKGPAANNPGADTGFSAAFRWYLVWRIGISGRTGPTFLRLCRYLDVRVHLWQMPGLRGSNGQLAWLACDATLMYQMSRTRQILHSCSNR